MRCELRAHFVVEKGAELRAEGGQFGGRRRQGMMASMMPPGAEGGPAGGGRSGGGASGGSGSGGGRGGSKPSGAEPAGDGAPR